MKSRFRVNVSGQLASEGVGRRSGRKSKSLIRQLSAPVLGCSVVS